MMDGSRLTRLFDHYTRLWHFWLRDLRTGEVIELGTRRPYPIGSCFKLAVLMAYFEVLEDPAELDRAVTIPPERFRIGGGVINFLDSPVTLTWRQMLHLMLACSDGTCTDWLIARLGLPAVNVVLRRHAPESDLPMDLGDMVAAFRRIPGALDCKNRAWTDSELVNFNRAVAELGATNAEDLAQLALAAWEYAEVAASSRDYERCLGVGRYHPRFASFISPALRCFGKTGSFGLRFLMDDCGVLLSPDGKQQIAHFGYCSVGWQMPALAAEVMGGLIGVEVVRALGIEPEPNMDYTPDSAEIFLGFLNEDAV